MYPFPVLPVPGGGLKAGRGRSVGRPMDGGDYQLLEQDLQQQMQAGRIHSNNLTALHEYSLHGVYCHCGIAGIVLLDYCTNG